MGLWIKHNPADIILAMRYCVDNDLYPTRQGSEHLAQVEKQTL